MTFSNVPTAAFIANQVWAFATRNLTSLGAGTQSVVAINHQALANGAVADLRPATGRFRDIFIVGELAANVNWTAAIFDGTTTRGGTSGGSGLAFDHVEKGNLSMGPALSNSGTVSGNFDVGGVDWVQ